jgi:hypothetical protein
MVVFSTVKTVDRDQESGKVSDDAGKGAYVRAEKAR